VTVILSPEAEVEQFIQPCESGVLFQAKGDAFDSIFWDFGDNSEIIINDNPVSHEFDNPNFNCTVIFKNSLTGCVDTQFVTGNDTSGKIQELQIANTITPNNDGFNDCFRIYGFSPECEKGYLRIYNRWGALVFHTDDLAHCWDGTVENAGPEVPSGTYFYILDLEETQNPNNPKMLNGVIHVIR
jgi:gliding motility-associated-like protein